MSPTPIKMNARGNPQKKEGKMRIRAFPVSVQKKTTTTTVKTKLQMRISLPVIKNMS